jgi:molecular chaperone DnaK (HSP70)
VIRLPGIDRVQSPEEIASFILASLVSNASKRLQQDVKKCVVTVPAYFGNL